MTFDVQAIRAQVPILGRQVNGAALHYLDNSATAQMPEAVLVALRRHETEHRANVLRGVHTLAEAATEAYESARNEIAQYLNVDPEEVVCAQEKEVVGVEDRHAVLEHDDISVRPISREASRLVPPISSVIRFLCGMRRLRALAPITPPAGPDRIR